MATIPDNIFPVKKFANYTSRGLIRNFRKGEHVIAPGTDEVNSFLYVVSGRISAYLVDGAERILMFYCLRNHVLDYMFARPLGISTHSEIIADEDSSVCFFRENTVLDIVKNDDGLLRELFRSYTSKVGYFMLSFFEKSCFPPKIRILRFLKNLCLSQGQKNGNAYEIPIRLSQRLISEITGVHYVSLSRIMRDLKNDKLVTKTTYKIIVHDFAKLLDLIDSEADTDSGGFD
jgi:CRP-like cAMP-binding protein